jgi:hypothetical protein
MNYLVEIYNRNKIKINMSIKSDSDFDLIEKHPENIETLSISDHCYFPDDAKYIGKFLEIA